MNQVEPSGCNWPVDKAIEMQWPRFGLAERVCRGGEEGAARGAASTSA